MREMIDLLKSGDLEDYAAVFLALPMIAAFLLIVWAVFG